MELLIHELSALYFLLKAHKGPTVGAVIPGHALHVLKTLLYHYPAKTVLAWDVAPCLKKMRSHVYSIRVII